MLLILILLVLQDVGGAALKISCTAAKPKQIIGFVNSIPRVRDFPELLQILNRRVPSAVLKIN